MTLNEVLHRRLLRIRSRLAVRSWEYRQRHLSHGVWFRLRHVLTNASKAYAIPESELARLLDEGYKLEPVGRELEPEKFIVFVPAARAERIEGARELEVGLTAPFLDERAIALVRFSSEVGPT